MYCKKCGKQIDYDSLYCYYCGAKQSTLINTQSEEVSRIVNINTELPNSKAERPSTLNVTALTPKYEPTYEKEEEAIIVGVLIIIVSFFFLFLRPSSYSDYESYRQFNTFVAIGSIVLRIIVTIWCINIARKQNRETAVWGFFSFFVPAIALIVIGTRNKKFLIPEIIAGFSDEQNSALLTKKAIEFFDEERYQESVRFAEKAIELNLKNESAHEILKKSRLAYKETIGSIVTVYRELTDGRLLKISAMLGKTIGATSFIDNVPAADGLYEYKTGSRKILIADGKIKKCYFIQKFHSLTIEASDINGARNGDCVYLKNGDLAPSGEYSDGFMSEKIIVENGKFIRYK